MAKRIRLCIGDVSLLLPAQTAADTTWLLGVLGESRVLRSHYVGRWGGDGETFLIVSPADSFGVHVMDESHIDKREDYAKARDAEIKREEEAEQKRRDERDRAKAQRAKNLGKKK